MAINLLILGGTTEATALGQAVADAGVRVAPSHRRENRACVILDYARAMYRTLVAPFCYRERYACVFTPLEHRLGVPVCAD